MLKRYLSKQTKTTQRISLALVVLIVAGIGTYLLLNSHAATPYASITAASGTLSGGAAAKQSCTGASDGSCVMFGTTNTTTPTGDQPSPPALFDSSDGSTPYLTQAIPTNPKLDPNSATLVSTINNNIGVNTGPDWLVPVYNTNNSDPAYTPTLTNASAWGCSVGGSMHIPNFATREGPDASQGGDAWLATVNTDTNTVDAIWQASKSSGTWNGTCGGSYPLHGNGFKVGEAHPNEVIGVGTGAGAQIGAGMILYSELESGSINHALYTAAVDTCSTYRAPAHSSDGSGSGNSCWPEGARIQLNPSFNCNGLGGSAVETMICHTLETYGIYVLDSGGSGSPTIFPTVGDDMTDPGRSPWQTPGNPSRGSTNCTPISATCGVLAHFGVTPGNSSFPQIPTSQLRVLNSWNGQ